jgi:hypothetical protein
MNNILTVRGEAWNPACIDWTPVQPARHYTGGVQIAAPFTVQRADGTVLEGQADDYLFLDEHGELLPVPRSIGLLLFKPIIKAIEQEPAEKEQPSNDR